MEDGTPVGSLVTWALPNHGDRVRVYPADDPAHESVAYEVVRCEFEPDNIVVVVKVRKPPSWGPA
ncbi:MAG TPA: hypothetical protein VGO80_19655 [Solirubrobacteraceae bacterium]|jgi:hypothetical protein|nr:hypothetical protein [Solirubrobacteraceae bacterium]